MMRMADTNQGITLNVLLMSVNLSLKRITNLDKTDNSILTGFMWCKCVQNHTKLYVHKRVTVNKIFLVFACVESRAIAGVKRRQEHQITKRAQRNMSCALFCSTVSPEEQPLDKQEAAKETCFLCRQSVVVKKQ